MIQILGEKRFDFSYVSSGLFLTDEEWIHPRRQIDSYEIIYVLCGSAYIQAGERRHRLEKGDTLLLYPNAVHFGFQASTGKTSFYWAHFLVSDYKALDIEEEYFASEGDFHLTGYFRQLLHNANTPDYPPYSPDIALLMLVNEIAAAQKTRKQKHSKLVKEAAEWIRINADKKLTVESVAEYFSYNPDYLSLLFKKTVGFGLKQVINQEKIKYAKNLLLTSNYSVKQIAGKLGWDDENSFINFFKYHESISPTKYRNENYNTHLNKN